MEIRKIKIKPDIDRFIDKTGMFWSGDYVGLSFRVLYTTYARTSAPFADQNGNEFENFYPSNTKIKEMSAIDMENVYTVKDIPQG
jgi:hypothetical protein